MTKKIDYSEFYSLIELKNENIADYTTAAFEKGIHLDITCYAHGLMVAKLLTADLECLEQTVAIIQGSWSVDDAY